MTYPHRMTPERWTRLKELFSLALDSGTELDTNGLRKLCGGDDDLTRDLLALIREHVDIESRVATEELPTAPFDVPAFAYRRFTFQQRIGSGTFGDVYKVYDQQRGATVALKVLRQSSASGLLSFKREFRSLAGVEHPNLVRLYELIAEDARWMFTMEWLDGLDFLRHVGTAGDGNRGGLDNREANIRACIPQLTAALAALHQRGLLHRDLKPSNVVVTSEGRVCLLDFGLVRSLGEEATQTIAGTPDYMSPEQGAGITLTEASDWYSLGVMLYESLTGELPFQGSAFEVIRRKQTERPLPPSDLNSRIASDLNHLCCSLLDPDPIERMRAAAALKAPPWRPTLDTPRKTFKTTLLGRDSELQRLQDAYSRSLEGHCVVVHVYGLSGIGKTMLVREFLNLLRSSDPTVLAFAGRCYQSESVPFQGLDDLVDSMAHHLRQLPKAEVGQFLPRNISVISKMFPVLGQLPRTNRSAALSLDSVELRAQAFSALREMFGRIADRRRVVLTIDDLQWGGRDTSAFLRELTAYPDAPPLLLVLAYRLEDIEALSWLEQLHNSNRAGKQFAEHIMLNLVSLSENSTAQLAESLMSGGRHLGERAIRSVVEQSGGDPFLVHEAAHWALKSAESGDFSDSFDVETALKSRFDVLLSGDRRVLELVAVTGRPIRADVLKQIVAPPELQTAYDRLVTRRLLRSRSVEGRDELEVYHDRIRSAILRFLAADALRAYNADLARAFEAAGDADPERLSRYYWEAGDKTRAARNARIAGKRAVEALAFNKAASFFQLALQTGAIEGSESVSVRHDLGDALSNAGRSAEAADAYLDASTFCAGQARLRLIALAAGQLLRCGYVRKGKQLLRDVLREVGIHSPSHRKLQTILVGWLRMRIRLRGLNYKERSAAQLTRQQFLRLDLCASAALGLSMTDPLTSAEFSSRFLLLALSAGEPYRAALALAGEATQTCHDGSLGSYIRARRLLDRAFEIAQRIANPHAEAFAVLMSGVVSYLEGSWKRCCEECEKSDQLLRANCNGISWESSTANSFMFVARGIRGEWEENRRRLPSLIHEAETRGDLHASISLRILGCAYVLSLAAGQPEVARRELQRDLDAWPTDQYDAQRANGLLSRIDIALYCDEPEEGWQLLEQEWRMLVRSNLLSLGTTLAFSQSCRGRIALAMAQRVAESGGRVDSFLRVAHQSASALFRSGPAWGKGLGHLLTAGIATFERPDRARVELETAVQRLGEADLGPFRIAAMYRLSGMLPEPQSSVLLAEVNEWATRERVVNAARILSGLSPGRWTTGV
jgi:serine/threonine protein kinase